LFSIGCNGIGGCFGYSVSDNRSKIQQINYFKNIFIVDVVCGDRNCLAISNKSEIFAWSSNTIVNNDQIGIGKSF
jgi:alpha-tubulin suppressor-like RCC1 family protein